MLGRKVGGYDIDASIEDELFRGYVIVVNVHLLNYLAENERKEEVS